MSKKDPISIRFSLKELQQIEDFQKMMTEKRDQSGTIRMMVGMGYTLSNILLKFSLDPRVSESMQNYFEAVEKAKTPDQILQATKIMNKEVFPKLKKLMEEFLKIMDPFIEQKKAGRPKSEITRLKEKLRKGKISKKYYLKKRERLRKRNLI